MTQATKMMQKSGFRAYDERTPYLAAVEALAATLFADVDNDAELVASVRSTLVEDRHRDDAAAQRLRPLWHWIDEGPTPLDVARVLDGETTLDDNPLASIARYFAAWIETTPRGNVAWREQRANASAALSAAVALGADALVSALVEIRSVRPSPLDVKHALRRGHLTTLVYVARARGADAWSLVVADDIVAALERGAVDAARLALLNAPAPQVAMDIDRRTIEQVRSTATPPRAQQYMAAAMRAPADAVVRALRMLRAPAPPATAANHSALIVGANTLFVGANIAQTFNRLEIVNATPSLEALNVLLVDYGWGARELLEYVTNAGDLALFKQFAQSTLTRPRDCAHMFERLVEEAKRAEYEIDWMSNERNIQMWFIILDVIVAMDDENDSLCALKTVLKIQPIYGGNFKRHLNAAKHFSVVNYFFERLNKQELQENFYELFDDSRLNDEDTLLRIQAVAKLITISPISNDASKEIARIADVYLKRRHFQSLRYLARVFTLDVRRHFKTIASTYANNSSRLDEYDPQRLLYDTILSLLFDAPKDRGGDFVGRSLAYLTTFDYAFIPMFKEIIANETILSDDLQNQFAVMFEELPGNLSQRVANFLTSHIADGVFPIRLWHTRAVSSVRGRTLFPRAFLLDDALDALIANGLDIRVLEKPAFDVYRSFAMTTQRRIDFLRSLARHHIKLDEQNAGAAFQRFFDIMALDMTEQRIEEARLLVEAGARITDENVIAAAKKTSSNVVDSFLIALIDLGAPVPRLALLEIAQHGHVETFRRALTSPALARDALDNVPDPATPVLLAATARKQGDAASFVQMLIDARASIAVDVGNRRFTLGNVDTVRVLLRAGADPFRFDVSGARTDTNELIERYRAEWTLAGKRPRE